MTIGRVTQRMLTEGSLGNLQRNLGRLAALQEQLSTGRVINRPSDNPTGTTAAMRIRTSVSDQGQYARNAQDGLGWLTQVDSTLDGVTTAVRRARDLALQGANTGAMGQQARDALAIEVENLARTYVVVRSLGEPRLIDSAEMDRVLERFATYGQPRRA